MTGNRLTGRSLTVTEGVCLLICARAASLSTFGVGAAGWNAICAAAVSDLLRPLLALPLLLLSRGWFGRLRSGLLGYLCAAFYAVWLIADFGATAGFLPGLAVADTALPPTVGASMTVGAPMTAGASVTGGAPGFPFAALLLPLLLAVGCLLGWQGLSAIGRAAFPTAILLALGVVVLGFACAGAFDPLRILPPDDRWLPDALLRTPNADLLFYPAVLDALDSDRRAACRVLTLTGLLTAAGALTVGVLVYGSAAASYGLLLRGAGLFPGASCLALALRLGGLLAILKTGVERVVGKASVRLPLLAVLTVLCVVCALIGVPPTYDAFWSGAVLTVLPLLLNMPSAFAALSGRRA